MMERSICSEMSTAIGFCQPSNDFSPTSFMSSIIKSNFITWYVSRHHSGYSEVNFNDKVSIGGNLMNSSVNGMTCCEQL